MCNDHICHMFGHFCHCHCHNITWLEKNVKYFKTNNVNIMKYSYSMLIVYKL